MAIALPPINSALSFYQHTLFALKAPHSSKETLFCRALHHDSHILVCSQHYTGVLWPVLSRDKVSLHQHITWNNSRMAHITLKRYVKCNVPQIWDWRGLVYWLGFGHTCPLWRIMPDVCLQSWTTHWKNVSMWAWNNSYWLGLVKSELILLTVKRILCFSPYPYQPASRGHMVSTATMSQSVPSNYGRNAYV